MRCTESGCMTSEQATLPCLQKGRLGSSTLDTSSCLQVREEQAALRPDPEAVVTGEVLGQMTYTRQVVREILRYRPPAPMVPQVRGCRLDPWAPKSVEGVCIADQLGPTFLPSYFTDNRHRWDAKSCSSDLDAVCAESP